MGGRGSLVGVSDWQWSCVTLIQGYLTYVLPPYICTDNSDGMGFNVLIHNDDIHVLNIA